MDQDVTAQKTRIENHSNSTQSNLNIPFHDDEEFFVPKTELRLADRVRFEITEADVDDGKWSEYQQGDDAACLEAYSCTQTQEVTEPDETYLPFDRNTLRWIAKNANPDLEYGEENAIQVHETSIKSPDGWVQEVTVECQMDVTDPYSRFRTVVEYVGDQDGSNTDYHYKVKTTYNVPGSNEYETLGKIRIRNLSSEKPAKATGWEVRLSMVVHPEKDFDPSRVPGNESETYKIGNIKHKSYDRHVAIPSRLYGDGPHIYCTEDETFKRRAERDGDCEADHLENPFIGLEEGNWDEVVIEYNNRETDEDQWQFRVYSLRPSACPEHIEHEGENNKTYSGIGLTSTSLAIVLDAADTLETSLSPKDIRASGDKGATQQSDPQAFENDVDRLLTAVETATRESTRRVMAKGLRSLTDPGVLDMEHSTTAVVNVDATERLVSLLEDTTTKQTQEHLCRALRNILDCDFSSGPTARQNTTISENFVTADGPDRLLNVFEASDHLATKTNALAALHEAYYGWGYSDACGAAFVEADGIQRLLTAFEDATDNDVREKIATVFRCYSKNDTYSTAFVKSGAHEQLLTSSENTDNTPRLRSQSVRAVGLLTRYEPESLAKINAPDRFVELVASSENDIRYEAVSSLFHYTRTSEGVKLVAETAAPEQLFQIVEEGHQKQKHAAKALRNIVDYDHQAILEVNGPTRLLNGVLSNDTVVVQQPLAKALSTLTSSTSGKNAVSTAGRPERLLTALEAENSSSIRGNLATVVCHVSTTDRGKRAFVDADGPERILTVLEHTEKNTTRNQLTDALIHLTTRNASIESIVAANGPERLLSMLEPADYNSMGLAYVVKNLTTNETGRQAMLNADGAARLVDTLENTESTETRRQHAISVLNLTETTAGKRAVRKANGPRRIQSVLPASEKETQDVLEKILHRLQEDTNYSGVVTVGALLTGLFYTDWDKTQTQTTTNPEEFRSDTTSESDRYMNRPVRAIASFSRVAGRAYGRIRVAIYRRR